MFRLHFKANAFGDSLFALPQNEPGRVAQSVGRLTRKSGVLGSIPSLHILSFLLPLSQERVVVSYWRKYVHEELVNSLGDLSLLSKSVARLTDRPDVTLDAYSGGKTTTASPENAPPPHAFALNTNSSYFPGPISFKLIGMLLR